MIRVGNLDLALHDTGNPGLNGGTNATSARFLNAQCTLDLMGTSQPLKCVSVGTPKSSRPIPAGTDHQAVICGEGQEMQRLSVAMQRTLGFPSRGVPNADRVIGVSAGHDGLVVERSNPASASNAFSRASYLSSWSMRPKSPASKPLRTQSHRRSCSASCCLESARIRWPPRMRSGLPLEGAKSSGVPFCPAACFVVVRRVNPREAGTARPGPDNVDLPANELCWIASSND
jgi:hypothetical protein